MRNLFLAFAQGDSQLRGQIVHPNIVRIHGNGIGEQARAAQQQRWAVRFWQVAVVVAAAIAKPLSPFVARAAGNDHQIQLLRQDQKTGLFGRQDAKSPGREVR